jgi:hypothetical protein
MNILVVIQTNKTGISLVNRKDNIILEFNSEYVTDKKSQFMLNNTLVMFTPPIGEDFWIMRVPLTDKQAIVTFPKFGTYGIGFQVEEDWNTNLPYTCDKEEIYNHIEYNKGDDSISKEDCINAIDLLQKALKEYLGKVS